MEGEGLTTRPPPYYSGYLTTCQTNLLVSLTNIILYKPVIFLVCPSMEEPGAGMNFDKRGGSARSSGQHFVGGSNFHFFKF